VIIAKRLLKESAGCNPDHTAMRDNNKPPAGWLVGESNLSRKDKACGVCDRHTIDTVLREA
jgi:hypothetical protein